MLLVIRRDLIQLFGLCAGSFRSPNRKRRKRAGIIDIGNWPSPATAANPPPSRRVAMTTTPNTTTPGRTFSMSQECSIGRHLRQG